ncbi:restriction endonuclease subunit S [Streptomyces sp. NPDC049687]|uniref:restriction endonuclease subunit S n=1 Tax=Streptomyces sp. NPDC049687 TaxID=3365596 RepID=UPI0037947586
MPEWRPQKLGELVSIKHGFAFKGEYFTEVPPGPVLVTPGNFSIGGGFRKSKPKYYVGPVPEGFTLSQGDLVVTMTDLSKGADTLGFPAIIPDGGVYLHNQRIGLVCISRPDLLDKKFLYYALRVDAYHQHVVATATGSTVKHTSPNRICEYDIALPLLPEQQAVAEVLGALDDKIALNERIRETSLSLASACYEANGTSGEPDLIGDLAVLFDGPHATPHKTETGPWFLSISSLKNGYLDLTESAHLSEGDFPRWTRRVQPKAGDVLFSYETRLGDAALMPPGVRGSLGRRMALLRSKSASVSGALLLHAYLSPAFQEEIKRRTVYGATVDRLPLKEMPSWRILLPAEGERERLSARLEALHATVTQTANENRTLADLRDTLLPQLLSGKLRVRDAVRTVEEAV